MTYQIKLSPRSQREATIQNRQQSATEAGTLWDFRGDKASLKIITLPVDLPIYRMDNCRTYSDQQDAIAKDNLAKDIFTKGQELSTVQERQHTILVKLARKEATSVSAIMGVLKTEGQRDPILITATGVVVNGNRRLAAMRELYAADESPTSAYAHVKCMILPPDTSADEIDDIEANEQARPETKLEYDWIGDAQLVRRQINKGRTPKNVATQLRRSEADIKNLLQSIDEADMYLNEWAHKPGQYSLISGDGEQIFGDLPKRLVGQSIPLQNASRAIAWSLFENREQVPGRIYAFNAAFGKLAPSVLKSMAEQLNLPTAPNASGLNDDDSFAIDVPSGEDTEDYSNIIIALKNDDSRGGAVEALIEAAVSALERDRGQKNKYAALKALVQIHSKLAGVDLTTAGMETYGGIAKQIESIKQVLEKLATKLTEVKQMPSEDADGQGRT